MAQLREQLFTERPAAKSYRMVRRFAFAASILIIIASGIYFFGPTKQASEFSQFALAEFKNQFTIAPGGEAILTLSNGSKIPLRNKADGLLATLNNGKQLLKQDGKLVYQSAVVQSTAGEVDYTPSPRSDQYSVVLPDGSRVWLNRGSTLSYPEKFADDRRVVEINGEGYFEIAKAYAANGKDRLPFIVKVPAQSNSGLPSEVEVLGTHFNIYAHKHELVKTTLTEGKVKMTSGSAAQVLKPGQQAVVDSLKPAIAVKDNVNVEDVLAWREEQFRFENESIRTILSEIKRWNGDKKMSFSVVGKQTATFSLSYDRNKPISEVINHLKISGKAPKITIEGNHVSVTFGG